MPVLQHDVQIQVDLLAEQFQIGGFHAAFQYTKIRPNCKAGHPRRDRVRLSRSPYPNVVRQAGTAGDPYGERQSSQSTVQVRPVEEAVRVIIESWINTVLV